MTRFRLSQPRRLLAAGGMEGSTGSLSEGTGAGREKSTAGSAWGRSAVKCLCYLAVLEVLMGNGVKCGHVEVRDDAAYVSTSSGLLGAIAQLQVRRDFSAVVIEKSILIDQYAFLPTVDVTRNVVISGKNRGVEVHISDRNTPLLNLGGGAELTFTNITLRVVGRETAQDLFAEQFSLVKPAKVQYKGVTMIVDVVSWFAIAKDMQTIQDARIRFGEGITTVTSLPNAPEYIVRNVLIQQQSVSRPSQALELAKYEVSTAMALVTVMRIAEVTGGGSPLEILLKEDITIRQEDLGPEGTIAIRRKVILRGSRSDGIPALLRLDANLANGGFAKIFAAGELVYVGLFEQFAEASTGEECPEGFCEDRGKFESGVSFAEDVYVCGITKINTTVSAPCDHLDGYRTAANLILAGQSESDRFRLGDGLPLVEVTPDEGEETVQITKFVGQGTCMSNSLLTCGVVDLEGGGVSDDGDGSHKKSIYILVGVAGGVILLCILAIVFYPRYLTCFGLKDKIVRRAYSAKGGGGWHEGESTSVDVKSYLMGQITGEQHGITDEAVEIIEEIASGGYGVVYKGSWKGLPVAIKTVVFQDMPDEAGKEKQRAIFEAAISSSIAHKNVVQTYAYSFKPLRTSNGFHHDNSFEIRSTTNVRTSMDWKLYIVQELCEKGSLRNALRNRMFGVCDKHKSFVLAVLQVSLDIAEGLSHLHHHNIVHGDVNTKNVLLQEEKEPRGPVTTIAKMADFGLSVKMKHMQSHVSNHKAGTPFYMAPEVAQEGVLSKKSDVFSFGVVLWELYHQSSPIQAVGNSGQLQYHQKFPKFPVSCPMLYALLCVVCLSPKPEERPEFDFIIRVLQAIRDMIAEDQEFLPAKIQKQNMDLVRKLNGKCGRELVDFLAEELDKESERREEMEASPVAPTQFNNLQGRVSFGEESPPLRSPIHSPAASDTIPEHDDGYGLPESFDRNSGTYTLTMTLGSEGDKEGRGVDPRTITFTWDPILGPDPHTQAEAEEQISVRLQTPPEKLPDVLPPRQGRMPLVVSTVNKAVGEDDFATSSVSCEASGQIADPLESRPHTFRFRTESSVESPGAIWADRTRLPDPDLQAPEVLIAGRGSDIPGLRFGNPLRRVEGDGQSLLKSRSDLDEAGPVVGGDSSSNESRQSRWSYGSDGSQLGPGGIENHCAADSGSHFSITISQSYNAHRDLDDEEVCSMPMRRESPDWL